MKPTDRIAYSPMGAPHRAGRYYCNAVAIRLDVTVFVAST